MEISKDASELAQALVAALAEMPAAELNKVAKIQTKNGGEFRYSYADLGAIIASSRPILARHGLTLLQPVSTTEDGRLRITTVLFHTSGQYLSSTFEVPLAGTVKDIGAQITYYRRYTQPAMLNMYADEDTDGGRDLPARPSAPRRRAGAPAPVESAEDENPFDEDVEGAPMRLPDAPLPTTLAEANQVQAQSASGEWVALGTLKVETLARLRAYYETRPTLSPAEQAALAACKMILAAAAHQ